MRLTRRFALPNYRALTNYDNAAHQEVRLPNFGFDLLNSVRFYRFWRRFKNKDNTSRYRFILFGWANLPVSLLSKSPAKRSLFGQ